MLLFTAFLVDFGEKQSFFRFGADFFTLERRSDPSAIKSDVTLRHVATFAKASGEEMSCHVETFATNPETCDIDICL